MHPTRARILDHLKKNGPSDAISLAKHLRVTPPNVRHHLHAMEAEQWVLITGQRKQPQKGRPTLLYGINPQHASHNLDGLSSALLKVFLEDSPPKTQERRLQQLAAALTAHALPIGGSLTQRLHHAIRQLNAMNYQARWEAHADAPRLILGGCPYHAILSQHTELCQMDIHLLKQMTNAEVTQLSCQATSKHERFCTFQIR